MITDLQVQHELLKTALEATDNYLFYEKRAKEAGVATSRDIHNFTYEMSRAHDALQSLGVLDQHEDYMKFHVGEMMKLLGHDDKSLSDLPYVHVPQSDTGEIEEANVWDKPSPVKKHEKLSPATKAKAKARARAAGRPYPNMVDNIWAARQQESKLISFGEFISESKEEPDTISEDEIDAMVEDLKWEDIVDLYPEEELVYEEMEMEQLDEKLTAQSRLKKRQAFARMRGKRNVARSIKLRRASNMETLKKRAVLAARRAVYKRFLRGRDKSALSAAEKDRVEQQVSRMKYMQSAIAMKMLPKMRAIEQKRLASMRGGATKTMKPSKAPKLKPSKAPKARK